MCVLFLVLFLSNGTAYAHHLKKRLKITSTVVMGMNVIYTFGENFGDHPSVTLGEHKLDIISVEDDRIEAWLPEALENPARNLSASDGSEVAKYEFGGSLPALAEIPLSGEGLVQKRKVGIWGRSNLPIVSCHSEDC